MNEEEIKKCKLSFLGVGWIGLNRMQAASRSGIIDVFAVADPDEANRNNARQHCNAPIVSSIDELLEENSDGMVIATPSALHALHSIIALNNQLPVFCQKPLGRTAVETATIVNTAKEKNLLLGVDFSYRHTCFRLLYDLIQRKELGEIYAIEMCFHNAYGPDKAWFYNAELSGGGCVIDLGVHLIDLALWCLDEPEIKVLQSQLFSYGKKLSSVKGHVEDHAVVLMETDKHTTIQLNCSWHLPAGKEAEIYFKVYGTAGGASFHNINGSFYDFEVARFHGTQTEILFTGEDDWGGRAITAWCEKLAFGSGYDPSIASVIKVATVIDDIYEGYK